MTRDRKARRKPSYARHWAFVGAAAALIVLRGLAARPRPRPSAAVDDADWYLALRLPLRTEPGARERQELGRLREWLDGLQRAGFVPIRLTEARARLARGGRLPGRPVVLVIEPGYSRTAETVLPFLAARGVPAVWLVDGAAVERGDERYVSRHALARLQDDPLGETGFLRGSTRTFTLAGSDLAWREDAGRTALNRGAEAAPLSRLNVNFSWTGPQLVSRLEAEAPVIGPTRLTTVRLFGKLWGAAADPSAPSASAAFDLRAPLGARSASIAWPSTAGCRDFDLDVSADSLSGGLWIYLRYDRKARRGLRIGYASGQVVAEERRGGGWNRLGAVPRGAAPGGALRSRIRLKGSRLGVAAEDGAFHVFALEEPPSRTGVILLQTYDNVRGVAGARSLRLALKPS